MRDKYVRPGTACLLTIDGAPVRVVVVREGSPAPGKSRRCWYVRREGAAVEEREPVTSSKLQEVAS